MVKQQTILEQDKIANIKDALPRSIEIARFLDSKKTEEVQIIDLQKVNPYFGFFVIATANSSMQLKSLVREIRRTYSVWFPAKNSGFRSEDLDSGWVILDFIDVVVHIFLEEERKYYNLERVWGDAPLISFADKKK